MKMELCPSPLQEARKYKNDSFPLCLSPKHPGSGNFADFLIYTKANRSHLEKLVSRHGAILFRDCGVTSPQDFASFVADGLSLPNFPYVGGNAVRTAIVGDRVFTANESPPDRLIPFHHELAQTENSPRRILFYCKVPSKVGGQTSIVHSAEVVKELEKRGYEEFLKKLENGVRYYRVMTGYDRSDSAIGRGWKATLNVENRRDAEKVLKGRGYDWEWIGDGEDAMLKEITPLLDAIRVNKNGEKVFFNQLVAAWTGWRDEFNTPENCVRYADCSPLDQKAMEAARDIMEDCCVDFPWHTGDILYIDNTSAMHARRSFQGERRILASLAK